MLYIGGRPGWMDTLSTSSTFVVQRGSLARKAPCSCSPVSALMRQVALSPTPASTSALPAINSGRGLGVDVGDGRAPSSVATGRPSTVHFFQPPSRTAALSKPKARSIHHTRAAHMFTKRS